MACFVGRLRDEVAMFLKHPKLGINHIAIHLYIVDFAKSRNWLYGGFAHTAICDDLCATLIFTLGLSVAQPMENNQMTSVL